VFIDLAASNQMLNYALYSKDLLIFRHHESPTETYLEKVKKIEKISSHQGGTVYMENIKMI
jgi:hypothetical protein